MYQAEKTIIRCIESVICQTYKNLEILCGDDASTDTTTQLVDNFRKKDKRITLVRFEENRGQAAVRNNLIRRATGDFICFIDADDYVDKHFVEKLFQSLQEYNSEISVCNYFIEEISGEIKSVDLHYRGCISTDQFCEEIFSDHCPSFLWNKLFYRNIFVGNMFCEGIVWEDLEWMARTAIKVRGRTKMISFVQEPLYFYWQNPHSTCHKKTQMVYKSGCVAYAFYRRYCLAMSMNDQNLVDIAMAEWIPRMISYYTYKKYCEDEFLLKYEEELTRNFNSLRSMMIIMNRKMSIKEKVQYFFFYINKNIFFKFAKRRLGL